MWARLPTHELWKLNYSLPRCLSHWPRDCFNTTHFAGCIRQGSLNSPAAISRNWRICQPIHIGDTRTLGFPQQKGLNHPWVPWHQESNEYPRDPTLPWVPHPYYQYHGAPSHCEMLDYNIVNLSKVRIQAPINWSLPFETCLYVIWFDSVILSIDSKWPDILTDKYFLQRSPRLLFRQRPSKGLSHRPLVTLMLSTCRPHMLPKKVALLTVKWSQFRLERSHVRNRKAPP